MSYITPSMILTPLISSIITGLIAYLVGRLQRSTNEKDQAKKAREKEIMELYEEIKNLYAEIKKCKDCDRALLHETILQKCNAILIRGYVTPGEIDEIEYLNTPYVNNDGNHRAGNAVEMVYKLPRKENIEEDKK